MVQHVLQLISLLLCKLCFLAQGTAEVTSAGLLRMNEDSPGCLVSFYTCRCAPKIISELGEKPDRCGAAARGETWSEQLLASFRSRTMGSTIAERSQITALDGARTTLQRSSVRLSPLEAYLHDESASYPCDFAWLVYKDAFLYVWELIFRATSVRGWPFASRVATAPIAISVERPQRWLPAPCCNWSGEPRFIRADTMPQLQRPRRRWSSLCIISVALEVV